MKNSILIIPLLFAYTCSAQEIITSNEICEFSFEKMAPCAFKSPTNPITVSIKSTDIADDEKLIRQLEVNSSKSTQRLEIFDNTSLLAGNVGFISFADINFDNQPDLSITTSFGTPQSPSGLLGI